MIGELEALDSRANRQDLTRKTLALAAVSSDAPIDRERNSFTARAKRYASVGTKVGGVAARMAGARFLGIDARPRARMPPRWPRRSAG